MKEKSVIAIFGGSFNPPLNSHIYFAEEILRKFSSVKKVVFVPVNSKYNKEGLISNEHRYNMLKLICDKNEDLLLSNIDINSDRSLYTVEILELMKQEYLNNDIWLVIGSDNLKELSIWKESQKLIDEFKILVIERDIDNIDEIMDSDELLNKYKDHFIKMDENDHRYFSSSHVRDMIEEGKDVSSYMPAEVLNYIKENKLYL